ncbi:hypothetical protein L6164_030214 [Bauhinia variegata]|uniref:Uncharacterized protein n=1 Tax=Bauhinia variegata TaxID=167791 RepID=A0ACB9LBN8_BAUVA|nr:hypothetical protein L6164_030214 [Bauhinia variegata]
MGCCWPTLFTRGSDKSNNETQIYSENVHRVTSMQSWEEKLSEASRDGKIVVAKFCAPWCQRCRDIVSTYSDLANKYPHILFLGVDVDDLAELSTSWDISATPTFYFLKDGREIDKLVGADKSQLHKKTAAVAQHSKPDS